MTNKKAVDPDPYWYSFSFLYPDPGGKNFQIKIEKMQEKAKIGTVIIVSLFKLSK